MSKEEREEKLELLRDALWSLLHPYIPRVLLAAFLCAIVNCTAIFAAGAWFTRTGDKLDALIAQDRKQEMEIAAYQKNRRETIDPKLEAVTVDVAELKRNSGDRWKRSYQRQYNAELGFLNPTVKTPDIDAIANRLSSP